MEFSERPWKWWTLREWRCCGLVWQLLLTPKFPKRALWKGPLCPRCRVIFLNKIVSGGQTGVDRGAIGAALNAGLPYGGWVPQGRQAEDGVVPACFSEMQESDGGYVKRTRQNVEDHDGTLILNPGSLLGGGTKLTVEIAEKNGTSLLVLDVSLAYSYIRRGHDPQLANLILDCLSGQVRMWLQLRWLGLHPVHTLNVAGPRESKAPGIERLTFLLMTDVIQNIGTQA